MKIIINLVLFLGLFDEFFKKFTGTESRNICKNFKPI